MKGDVPVPGTFKADAKPGMRQTTYRGLRRRPGLTQPNIINQEQRFI